MTTFSAGDTVATLESEPIGRMNIAYMAVAMRDPNPVHVEDDFARQTGMPGVIAHGTFVLGLAGSMLTREFGVDAVQRWRIDLTAPVFPGDTLSAEAVAQEVDGDRLAVLLAVRNQDGTVVGRGDATVRL
ncbi:MaoC family protein [Euzebya pacifica]|uniref:MaoC family protein n=1 Tax=Euzebya pacifica TaxID=1608957 RepID=A0A346XWV0_9ACTN|nr:MaoC family dehydratase [Euzebya pacifica]AXV06697.1 MaoC family protein [Euzebya pacifica]